MSRTTNAIVNLTTKEYFRYSCETEKMKKLQKLTDYTKGTKLFTFLLQFFDKTITYENCGECYWNKNDEIREVDLNRLEDGFSLEGLDEVPEDFTK